VALLWIAAPAHGCSLALLRRTSSIKESLFSFKWDQTLASRKMR
jgi:hypothetical protein